MADYSVAAVAEALAVDPGDVVVIVGADTDPLTVALVTEVHTLLDADGVRTVPEAFLPGLTLGETWLTLGPAVDNPRTT